MLLITTPIVAAVAAAVQMLSSMHTVQPAVSYVYPPNLPALQSTPLNGNDFIVEEQIESTVEYVKSRISYRSNGLKISGTLIVPTGEGPFPVIVTNHGFIDPRVYTNGRGLKREGIAFAKAGFAVLHSDYRGHALSDPNPDTSLVYDASIGYTMDVVNAVYALQAANIPRIDTTRIAMLGHSMGGGIALNIATMFPELVDVYVLYAPVHANAWYNFDRWLYKKIGDQNTLQKFDTAEKNPTFWQGISSQTYLRSIAAPIHIFHGTSDSSVPVQWSRDLYTTLQSNSIQVEYAEYANEQHEFAAQWSNFITKSITIFDCNLKDHCR